jgi:hypothetical protein
MIYCGQMLVVCATIALPLNTPPYAKKYSPFHVASEL